MLEMFSSIAIKLRWSKPIAVLVGSLFFAAFIASILDVGFVNSEAYLIPSVLGVIWMSLYFLFLDVFPGIPPEPGNDVKFLTKVKIKLRRGFYLLLGLLLIALTIAVMVLSVKLLGVWRAEY